MLAPGYPSRFSLEVLETVARSAPGAGGRFCPFFMVRKANGAVVVEIGASLDGASAQVGYTVVEPSWGQGYATEASASARWTASRPSWSSTRPWPTP